PKCRSYFLTRPNGRAPFFGESPAPPDDSAAAPTKISVTRPAPWPSFRIGPGPRWYNGNTVQAVSEMQGFDASLEALRSTRKMRALQHMACLLRELWKQGRAQEQLREILRVETGGKLRLVSAHELEVDGDVVFRQPLEDMRATSVFRGRLRDLCRDLRMDPEAGFELELAAGEAAANAVKHAGAGWAEVYYAAGRLVVRIGDCGRGIQPVDLPDSVLSAGHSTAGTLGVGYTLMLGLVDVAWLSTGPDGTVVQLQKDLGVRA
ncbi:MAG: ATP-binding protein, partial [Armatimonadetes bacterium]|nr:ATP-binding protein [Armatimonadota bacterium]